MIGCMIGQMIFEGEGPNIDQSQLTLLVKLPCGIALHLSLVSDFRRAMSLMKYSAN